MGRSPVEVIILALIFLVSGCTQEAERDDIEIVVYMSVEGLCREDHVESWFGGYSGGIVYTRNTTNGSGLIFGSVSQPIKGPEPTFQRLSAALENEELDSGAVSQPTYEPPASIVFLNLGASQLLGDTVTLHGTSEQLAFASSKETGYKSTCELQVLERLDHIPNVTVK